MNTAGPTHEPLVRRWGRRSLTLPAYAFAAAAMLLLAPLLFPLAAGIDLARRRGWVLVRCLAMVDVFLAAEVAGVVGATAIWLRGPRSGPVFLERNFRLQCWWANTLFRAGEQLFALRVRVEGDAKAARGPVLIFVRHVSPVDNLIPAVLLSDRHGLRLRWVLNRWLLRDPCLDIVGNRLANAFVRGGTDSDAHVAAVATLGHALDINEGAAIYPEGALFSPARRERALSRLGGSPWLPRAEALNTVLPPRMGGALALLEAAPAADVVVCAHRGFEPAGSYRAFLSGAFIGSEVSIAFWRFPREGIPGSRDERTAWLYDRWAEVDRWVSAAAGETPTAVSTPVHTGV